MDDPTEIADLYIQRGDLDYLSRIYTTNQKLRQYIDLPDKLEHLKRIYGVVGNIQTLPQLISSIPSCHKYYSIKGCLEFTIDRNETTLIENMLDDWFNSLESNGEYEILFNTIISAANYAATRNKDKSLETLIRKLDSTDIDQIEGMIVDLFAQAVQVSALNSVRTLQRLGYEYDIEVLDSGIFQFIPSREVLDELYSSGLLFSAIDAAEVLDSNMLLYILKKYSPDYQEIVEVIPYVEDGKKLEVLLEYLHPYNLPIIWLPKMITANTTPDKFYRIFTKLYPNIETNDASEVLYQILIASIKNHNADLVNYLLNIGVNSPAGLILETVIKFDPRLISWVANLPGLTEEDDDRVLALIMNMKNKIPTYIFYTLMEYREYDPNKVAQYGVLYDRPYAIEWAKENGADVNVVLSSVQGLIDERTARKRLSL